MPVKILVIDDINDTRELLHLYLTGEGFTVVTAATAAEGLYLATSEKPDLIIADLGLPDLDGIDLIKELRAVPALANVPIAVNTAYAPRTDEAIQAGASLVILKPSKLDDMITDIQRLLEQTGNKPR
jgi:two-component system KDP operon response regulator KdpE